MCLGPEVPGGNPVMPAPEAPMAPVTQEGPVFVRPAPDSTPKFPADARPGSVAASAVAGQMSKTRAAKPSDRTDRRMFFTLGSCLKRRNNISKIAQLGGPNSDGSKSAHPCR